MTYRVSAAAWKMEAAAGAAIDQTPSTDASLEVAPAGTRLVLSSFEASYSVQNGNFTGGLTFATWPRVYFRDASASPAVVFGAVATVTRALGHYVTCNQGGVMVTIPGPGVLFDNGLSISIQSPAVTSYSQTITLNIMYQV